MLLLCCLLISLVTTVPDIIYSFGYTMLTEAEVVVYSQYQSIGFNLV